MAVTYTLWYSDASGRRIAPIDDFVDANGASFQYTRAVNAISPITIKLPEKYSYLFTDPNRWLDSRFEVMRRIDNNPEYLDTETAWIVRNVKPSVNLNGIKTLTITGYCANELLTRRRIAYAAGSSQSQKTAKIDDMMKAIMRENFGSSASAARSISTYLSIQADTSLGTTTSRAFSYDVVYDVLLKLAQESATTSALIFFDVVQVGTTFQFRTYKGQRGINRTLNDKNSFTLSLGAGLTDYEIDHDFTNEINFVYAGGAGQESVRIVASGADTTRVNMTPLNRRESFVNYSNSNVTSVLQGAALSKVREGNPRKVYTANFESMPGAVYGVHWGWGDKLPVDFGDGDVVNSRIDAITVTFQGGKESIRGQLRAET